VHGARTSPSKRVVLAFLLAGLVAAVPVAAQPPPPAPAPSPSSSAAPSPSSAPSASVSAAPPSVPPALPKAEAARADELFQEGKRLLEQGRLEAACPLLASSDALDPTIGSLGLLAACHEQQGRVATAWKDYREVLRRAEAARDDRAEFARQRVTALEPRLPRLVVRLASPTPGIEIRRDSEPLPSAEVGATVAVDPGAHEILASAPGRTDYRVIVMAAEGAVVTVDVPALQPIAPPPPPAPVASSVAETHRRSARIPVGLALGGVGLVGLGVGIAFGVSAINSNLDSNTVYDTCKAPGAPPDACSKGRDMRSSAFSAATVSTIGVSVGAAGVLAGALVLFLPSSKAPGPAREGFRVTPFVGPQGGGAVAAGSF
jgi:hypothetical protein